MPSHCDSCFIHVTSPKLQVKNSAVLKTADVESGHCFPKGVAVLPGQVANSLEPDVPNCKMGVMLALNCYLRE